VFGQVVNIRRIRRNLRQLQDDIGPIESLYRPGATPRAAHASASEPALVLDVRRLQLLGALQRPSIGQLVWGAAEQPDRPSALYFYKSEKLTIHEVLRGGSLAHLNVAVDVDLRGVFANSGSRPWLICPNRTADGVCGRRAAKLVLIGGEMQFKCRGCVGRQRSLRLTQLTDVTSHALTDGG
jgi:hypothetical protein